MNRRIYSAIALVVFCAITISLFQNCAGGLNTSDGEEVIQASSGDPRIAVVSLKLEPFMDLEFVVQGSLPAGVTYEWSHIQDGRSNACLEKSSRRVAKYAVNCALSGELVIAVKVMNGAQAMAIGSLTANLAVPTPKPGEISMTVTFNIPSGTGTGPWNTSTTMVETFVGQILRINNLDSITHQLHTNGTNPCPLGALIPAGGNDNCAIGATYTGTVNGALYDHLVGTSAQFYLVAYDGAQLYTQHCAGCHGGVASSTKRNSAPSDIRAAIQSPFNPAMNGASLRALTPRQLEAISYAIGGR